MAKLVVLYKKPADPAAFDRYYFEKHAPLAKKIPGLRKYETSRGAIGTPEGASTVHLIAILDFDSLTAIQAAFASPEGQVAAADIPNFAKGGADLMFFESEDV
jgi:uncharacterized protein (TIGR02118 family)